MTDYERDLHDIVNEGLRSGMTGKMIYEPLIHELAGVVNAIVKKYPDLTRDTLIEIVHHNLDLEVVRYDQVRSD